MICRYLFLNKTEGSQKEKGGFPEGVPEVFSACCDVLHHLSARIILFIHLHIFTYIDVHISYYALYREHLSTAAELEATKSFYKIQEHV